MEFEQSDFWLLPPPKPARTSGCHGDDFIAEGSDPLKTSLTPRCWDAWVVVSSLKSSSLNGHCAGVSKRGASAGVEAHDTSQSSPCCLDLQTRTPGTKATDGGARDALEPLVLLIGSTLMDRLDCQYAAKAVRNATRELAKLVAHSELGLRSTWCTETQTGQTRIHEGSQPQHSNSCWPRLEWI